MNKYSYRSYKNGELLYECFADDILEADKQLKTATGYDAVKCSWIGCSIEFYGQPSDNRSNS